VFINRFNKESLQNAFAEQKNVFRILTIKLDECIIYLQIEYIIWQEISERGVDVPDTELRKQIKNMLDKAERVDYEVRLPDTEFEVMCAVWTAKIPVTTTELMHSIGNSRRWRTPTLISFLRRLEERGFVASIKNGKERYYFPLAERSLYLRTVTKRLLHLYHGDSLGSLFSALYADKIVPDADIDTLIAWLTGEST